MHSNILRTPTFVVQALYSYNHDPEQDGAAFIFMCFRCCLVWLLVLLWKSATHYIGDRANVVLSLRNLLLHFSCAISVSPTAGNLPISSIGDRGNVALSLRDFVLHF